MKSIFTTLLLSVLLLFSSCATTKYSDNSAKNNYSNLQAGKTYVFTTKDKSHTKMVFNSIKDGAILGTTKSGEHISLSQSDIVSSRDSRKGLINTLAVLIGATGIAALLVGSSRTTY